MKIACADIDAQAALTEPHEPEGVARDTVDVPRREEARQLRRLRARAAARRVGRAPSALVEDLVALSPTVPTTARAEWARVGDTDAVRLVGWSDRELATLRALDAGRARRAPAAASEQRHPVTRRVPVGGRDARHLDARGRRDHVRASVPLPRGTLVRRAGARLAARPLRARRASGPHHRAGGGDDRGGGDPPDRRPRYRGTCSGATWSSPRR